MELKNRLTMFARAAIFAVLALGIMLSGLTITTYTVAKANDFVIAHIQTEPLAKQFTDGTCVE